MFRGREQSRPELGFRLLQRLAGDVEELGFVEIAAQQDGRNMIMVIGPHRRKSDARSEARAERATPTRSAASVYSAVDRTPQPEPDLRALRAGALPRRSMRGASTRARPQHGLRRRPSSRSTLRRSREAQARRARSSPSAAR